MPFSNRQKKIIKAICDVVEPYFEIAGGVTQYREGDGRKGSAKIHKEAKGLIIICRKYPDPTEQGYKTIQKRSLKIIGNTDIWDGKIGVVDLMNPEYNWINE